MQQFSTVRVCSLLLLGMLCSEFLGETTLRADELHHHRARLLNGLPNYNYAGKHNHLFFPGDAPKFASLLATANPTDRVVLTLCNPKFSPVEVSPSGIPWQNTVPAAPSSVLGRTEFQPTTSINPHSGKQWSSLPRQSWLHRPTAADATIVRRKIFAPDVRGLLIDHIGLDQVGITIYETGHIVCTGRLTHSGGIDGAIPGNRITLEVLGIGTNPLAIPPAPNGPTYVSLVKHGWISRGDNATVSLVPGEFSEKVRRHFDEITHIRVNLSYRQSR